MRGFGNRVGCLLWDDPEFGLRVGERGFDILGRPEGIEGLGGVDFDEAVFTHVDQTLDGAVSRLDPADPRATSAVIRLRNECVNAKEALSADTETSIPVLLPDLQTEVRLTRGEFERMIRPAIGATIASLRRALRPEGLTELRKREPRRRPPPLVILCDISGSMARYTRMFLHFMHAITNDRDRVFCFTFGTRLSNVTRALRYRDVDIALAKASQQVEDWSGGTRIGQALHEFNNKWSRRVLGQGAVVLLITDGLDREGAAGLAEEMERLHKSCSRLIWLNPLLRYGAYEPKSQGNKAMLPYVDEFRPVHNLESLAGLIAALHTTSHGGDKRLAGWQTELRKE